MFLKKLFSSSKEDNSINEHEKNRRDFLKKSTCLFCGSLLTSLIPNIGYAKKGKKGSVMFRGEEFLTLARTIYGEAEGETLEGKYAVGYTIKNRALKALKYIEKTKNTKHPFYGDGTLVSACLRPGQFSCWDEYNYVQGRRKRENPRFKKLISLSIDSHKDSMWVECMEIAKKIIKSDKHNPIEDCTHFISKGLTNPPNWASKRSPSFRIDNHLFYKLEA